MVNRYGKSSFVIIGIGCHHLGEHELAAQFDAHWHANKSLSVYRHEVDIFRSGKFRRTNKISFVFAVGIIRTKDDFALSQVFQCLFYRRKFKHALSP